MSRVLVAFAAVCAVAGLVGGIPPAGADPVPACGPDQATAVDLATAHDQHDSITHVPWNPVPLQSTFNPCADLSAVLLSIDKARPNSPRQVFLFHRGTYIGTAVSHSRPFTTLDVASSTPNLVVIDFVSGRTCTTCDDGATHAVRYVWNGATAIMLDPIPPKQIWPIP